MPVPSLAFRYIEVPLDKEMRSERVITGFSEKGPAFVCSFPRDFSRDMLAENKTSTEIKLVTVMHV